MDTLGEIPRPLLGTNFFQELACKIKLALKSSRKASPKAKIEVDKRLKNEGKRDTKEEAS